MKEKNLLPDNNDSSLEELTNQANQIIESLENEKDLNNSVERYQELLRSFSFSNNLIILFASSVNSSRELISLSSGKFLSFI